MRVAEHSRWPKQPCGDVPVVREEKMPLLDPDKAARSEAPRVGAALRKAGDDARNEAELRTAITRIISDFTEQLGLDIDLREEYTLVKGRADAVYNRFLLEYEPPRSLRDSNRYQSNKHAIAQVKQYLGELSEVERHRLRRLAGVATEVPSPKSLSRWSGVRASSVLRELRYRRNFSVDEGVTGKASSTCQCPSRKRTKMK